MIRLDTTTRKLQVVLGGAITTNQLPVMVNYADKTTTAYTGGCTVSNTNSTTPVDICAAPGASTVRDIDTVQIRNADTVSATVTVRYNDNSTTYDIIKITLTTGATLVYAHGVGWQVLTDTGTLVAASTDFASPPAIGATTPSTGKFSTAETTTQLKVQLPSLNYVGALFYNTSYGRGMRVWAESGAGVHIEGVSADGQLSYQPLFLGGSGIGIQVSGANVASFVAGGLDDCAIGSGTPRAGAFTTLSASSTVSGTGFSNYMASPPAIGGTAAAAGTFTTLTANTSLTAPSVSYSSVQKQSIWVPAGAMKARTTNGAASGTTEMATNKNMVVTLDFDATTQEFAQFDIRMPKSWDESTVTFIPVWSHASTTTNFGVVWGLDAVAISDDDTLDVAFGTEQTSTDTGGTTNDLYHGPESSAITIAGTPQVGDYVQFRIHRNPANGSDTMAIDARLHGVLLFYNINTSTDA